MKTVPNSSMARVHSRRRTAIRWIGMVAGTVLAWRAQAESQYDPDWARHLRIGVLGGFNIKTSLRPINSALSVSGGKKGVFDDGYVIPDPANKSTGANADMTSNWGYNDASQYDPVANTLTMHQTTSFTPLPTGGTAAKEDSGVHAGFELEYGGNFWYWKQFRFGWDFGFGLMPIEVTDRQPMHGNVTRSFTTFDTGTGFFFFPPAGYQGHAGDGGAAIHSNPVGSGDDPGTLSADLSGTRTLDVMLYTLRLGPSAFWDLNDYIGVSLGLGPAVGIVSGEYRFDETINVNGNSTANKGHFSNTELLFGGYISGMITYHAVKNGDFFLSAQYMPLGSTTFSKGGRSAKIDLSGAAFISAGINWPF